MSDEGPGKGFYWLGVVVILVTLGGLLDYLGKLDDLGRWFMDLVR